MRWLGVLVALLAAPTAAQGSTVTMEQRYEPGHRGPDYIVATAHVRAAPGEANAIAVRVEGGAIVVDDPAGLQAGTGCAGSALDEARCAAPPGAILWIDVDTADGDDQVSLEDGVTGRLALGEGDDRVQASGTAAVDGGPGNDVLTGGPGAETLDGGPGDDDIAGGAGDDYLDGGGGADRIAGGGGDDSVHGGPGDDVVDLGPGRDSFASTAGADRVLMRDGEDDRAVCGRSGSARADAGDLVLRCAHVERSGPGRVTLAPDRSLFGRRSVGVHLLCSSDLLRGCAGRVTARIGGRLAGRVRFALPPDEGGMVPVALRLFARTRLIHAKHARVDLRVDTRDASGHPVTLRRRVVVEDV